MRLVLDANEYIFAFGLAKKEECAELFRLILQESSKHSIHICRTILDEVRQNLFPKEFRECIIFVINLTTVDEDFFIPFELGAKYEAVDFRPADAVIAAYAEYVGADVLVSENRHFLVHHSNLPFKVLTAEKCLSLIKHPLK